MLSVVYDEVNRHPGDRSSQSRSDGDVYSEVQPLGWTTAAADNIGLTHSDFVSGVPHKRLTSGVAEPQTVGLDMNDRS